MVGSSEAGLSEVLGYVLKLFSPEEQLRLAGNVVLLGSLAKIPGLKQRVHKDLISIRPFQSYSNVTVFDDPFHSPWLGAKNFANEDDFMNYMVKRDEYTEFGGEYFKEHIASNTFTPSPKEQIVEVDT